MTTITGTANNDVLSGGAENDIIRGLAGNDQLRGEGGDDILDGGSGNDTIDGGAGIDTATYAEATTGVIVNLGLTVSQSTLFGRDTLISIENVIGSRFADTLSGNSGDNVIDGNDGVDQASYAFAAAGVVVDLGRNDAQDTIGAGRDRLIAIENLLGSAFDDLLAGNSGNNTLGGGAGIDTLSYAAATAGVVVNLGVNFQQDTIGAGRDTLFGFENLIGSAFNDILYGNSGNNVLDGGAGIDTLSYVEATAGVTVSLAVTAEQDTLGAGRDTIAGFENLTGSAFDDVIAGNSGANILRGGGGIDTVSYAASSARVNVNLSGSAFGMGEDVGSDSLFGFENIIGSGFDDELDGNDDDNVITGGAGNDTIQAAGGRNVIDGGNGNDRLFSSSDAIDLIIGGDGIDRWRLGTSSTALDFILNGAEDALVLPNGTTVTEVEIIEILGSAGGDSFTISNLASAGGAFVIDIDGDAGSDRLQLDQSANVNLTFVRIGVSAASAQNFEGSASDAAASVDFTGLEEIDIRGSNQGDLFLVHSTEPLNTGGSLTLDGGAGFDSLSIDFSDFQGLEFTVAANGEITSNRGSFKSFERFDILLGSGANLIRTGAGDDLFIAFIGGDDLIDGGDGHDIVQLSAFQSDFNVVRNGLGGFAYFGPVGGVIGFHRFENIERIELLDATITSLALAGSTGADSLAGTSLIDLLDGLAGDDSLTGFGGNDSLNGGAGNDTAVYRGSRDNYVVTIDAGSIEVVDLRTTASDGIDTLTDIEFLRFADQTLDVTDRPTQAYTGTAVGNVFTVTDANGWTLSGLGGVDRLTGGGRADVIIGGTGNDILKGGDGNDRFEFAAGDGIDNIDGGLGFDTILATSANAVIAVIALTGIEAIDAGGFAGVRLAGSAGNDVLDLSQTLFTGIVSIGGAAGNDTITGSAAADRIIGGAGADTLAGGTGADIFAYSLITESGVGTTKADRIVDFTPGEDSIDLGAIDAINGVAGNQGFTFIGTAAFTALGQLRLGLDTNGQTALFGNTTGGLAADFQISLPGNPSLSVTDLIL